MKNPQMGLRGRSEEVHLVVENGAARPVIGTSEPVQDEDAALAARVRVAAHWGGAASPRAAQSGGVTEPLPLRSRTILATRLPQDARQALATGLPGHEKVPESGVVATVRLDKC
jgi:hypothetical protein